MGFFWNPHQVIVFPYLVFQGPMDVLASLQGEAREECSTIHHWVLKNGYYVGYISQKPRLTPQLFEGFT